MPAVVRVKRRHDEEPLEAFLLNGKRRHIDEGDSVLGSEISTILKFAGTVESQDEIRTKQIARLSKDEAKELVRRQRQPTNVTERARREMRAHGQDNRFKVVNCFRTIDTESDATTSKEITIVDIEKQPASPIPPSIVNATNIPTTSTIAAVSTNPECNAQTSYVTPTDSDGYVYDLYLPENEMQADDVDYEDNYLSIKACDHWMNEDCYSSDDDNDSQDSNQENYYCNDYPDEDEYGDDDSIGERDMINAVNCLRLGSDDEDCLSSDDEVSSQHDDYITTDYRDVDRYGTAYARYKARIMRNLRIHEHGYDPESEDTEGSSDTE